MSVLSAIRACLLGDPHERLRDDDRDLQVAKARATMDETRTAMTSGVRLMKTFNGAMRMMENERARER